MIQPTTGGFHSHGGTPIVGWFIGESISKWIMVPGVPPNSRKPPFLMCLHRYSLYLGMFAVRYDKLEMLNLIYVHELSISTIISIPKYHISRMATLPSIWRFPKIGVPPSQHPCITRFSPYKPSILGYP